MSKSPSLRRIQADIRELAHDPSDRYHAAPLEDDMFEWHFTIRGADGTDFEGGIYHGRILLPPEYPFKPPHILLLTPSGRFETNTKICLSFSAYHPELWQPAWGIRLILEALISFLPTPADGAIGALDWTSKERKRLAKSSQTFCCLRCGSVINLLPELRTDNETKSFTRFEKEIENLKLMQLKEHKEKKTITDVKAEEELEENSNADDEESRKEGSDTEQEDTNNETTPTSNTPSTTAADQLQREGEPLLALNEPTAEDILPKADIGRFLRELDIVWLTDPMLNVAIILLAVISFLLSRKCVEIYDELQSISQKDFVAP